MNTKNLTFSLFAILALVLSLSLVSAAQCLKLEEISPLSSVEHDQGSFTVQTKLSLDSVCSTDRTGITWDFTSNVAGLTWTIPTVSSLTAGSTVNIPIVFQLPQHKPGNIQITVSADSAEDDLEDFPLTSIPINNKAELVLTKTRDLTKTQSGIVAVKNDGNVVLNNLALSETTVFGVTLDKTTISSLSPGVSETVEITLPTDVDFNFGSNSVTIKAEDISNSVSGAYTFNIVKSFCEAGEIGGNLDIRDISIDNQGEGKDDEWQLLDVIEVEVEVENKGNDDVKDVFIELGLFDSDGNDMTSDLDFENSDEEQIDVGRLNEDDKETVTFTFRVPADFEDGNYKLAIKVYSDDLGEEVECSDTSSDLSDTIYEKISVERESDSEKFISFQNIVLTPSQATCGEIVTLIADVYNIGDEDQDQVKIMFISSELGINQFVEIRNDLDQGDKETVTFEFQVPKNLKNTNYYLNLLADYDYKSGNYRESSDEPTKVGLLISGCSGTDVPTGNIVSISATLESEAKAGKELIVRGSIINLKSETTTFVVSALDYEDWSTLGDISDRVITLNAGESKDVTFKFNVDANANGEKSFIIDVRADTDVQTREVAVNIAGSGSGITGFAAFGEGNSLIWIIGIINVVLIVLIIIVAVRISRR